MEENKPISPRFTVLVLSGWQLSLGLKCNTASPLVLLIPTTLLGVASPNWEQDSFHRAWLTVLFSDGKV